MSVFRRNTTCMIINSYSGVTRHCKYILSITNKEKTDLKFEFLILDSFCQILVKTRE